MIAISSGTLIPDWLMILRLSTAKVFVAKKKASTFNEGYNKFLISLATSFSTFW